MFFQMFFVPVKPELTRPVMLQKTIGNHLIVC